jgi:hypothetical protein
VILYLSFEELAALSASAEAMLVAAAAVEHGIVAPSRGLDDVEQFAHSLSGDIAITTLDEQERMLGVVRLLLSECRLRMNEAVLVEHAAAESAVSAYFTYAHVLAVEHRLAIVGEEMLALAHLMTGEDPDSETARRFVFPE